MATDPGISRQLVGRLGALLFAAAGLGGAASVLLPAPSSVNVAGVALVGLVAVVLGVVVWLLPWQRWPRAASLVLVPVAFGLIAVNNHVAGGEPYRYAISFALAFVWIGFGHPRGTSLRFAPLFLFAYLAPFFTTGTAAPVALSSALVVGPLCLVVGEAMAWVADRLRALELERAVASTETRFRALVQNAADVIVIIGADGQIEYESPAIERVLGHRVSARLGRSPLDLVHPGDQPRITALLRDLAARPGAQVDTTCRVRHADGSWRTVQAVGHNLLGDPDVRGLVFNYRDVSERLALEARLAHQALHDSLTGLPNRALFLDRLGHALARREGAGSAAVGVLVADLDDLRTINDSLGPAAGDRLLRLVADRLSGSVRDGDTVARLIGDEFGILLEGADPDEVLATASRLLDRLAEPFEIEGRRLAVSVSFGVAHGRAPEEADALLGHAEAALHVAKAAGHGRLATYEPAMERVASQCLDLRADLDGAAERGELVLHYQPLVALASGEVVGLEALLRWQHPGPRAAVAGRLHRPRRGLRRDRALRALGAGQRL